MNDGLLEFSRPKTKDETDTESSNLASMYQSFKSQWNERKYRLGLPDMLDEVFVLFDWGRPGYFNKAAPMCFMNFINVNGFIRLNTRIINSETKTLIVDEDVYARGLDGNTRGKGELTMNISRDLMQHLANVTTYTVFDLATPNENSLKYFTANDNYMKFDPQREQQMLTHIHDPDSLRWQKVTDRIKTHETYVGTFLPMNTLQSSSASALIDPKLVRDLYVIS